MIRSKNMPWTKPSEPAICVEPEERSDSRNVKQNIGMETSRNAPEVEINNFSFYYGETLGLKNISLSMSRHKATAIIGPSGCGKSTLLRCLNRMNDLVDGCGMEGTIRVGGVDIHSPELDVSELRKRIGMVFQKSNPFPKSIFENVVYGPKIHGTRKKSELEQVAEWSLKKVALWDEVKDRLHQSALLLSGGQQQRLCIARAIAVEPRVLLMDEPCSALDPIATAKIEELIVTLKTKYTIIIVTHNMQQAARVADDTGFLLNGELVEFGATEGIFTRPKKKKTEDYITGRFG